MQLCITPSTGSVYTRAHSRNLSVTSRVSVPALGLHRLILLIVFIVLLPSICQKTPGSATTPSCIIQVFAWMSSVADCQAEYKLALNGLGILLAKTRWQSTLTEMRWENCRSCGCSSCCSFFIHPSSIRSCHHVVGVARKCLYLT